MFQRFDYVVSLGGNCRTAWNLRRFFNFGNAFPFDWWITPCSALNQLLQDFDVDRLYTRDLLHEVKREDGAISSIRHRELGIIFQHEFRRIWDVPSNPVFSNWHKFLDRPKQRTKFLVDRLFSLNLSGTQILFVRNALYSEVEEKASLPVRETAERLRASFPRASIHLLLVNCPTRFDDRFVTHLDFPDTAKEWHGDWRAWQHALNGTGFQLINPTLRPFDITAEPESQTEKLSA
jgi:Putative papain-like cysteine peptidase (DUF1796)